MEILSEEIYQIKNFISSLNSDKDSIIVVEGKKDEFALKSLGYKHNIVQFHSLCGLTNFVDFASTYKNVILLFDSDHKGKSLTRKIIERLERRTRVDLSHKRRLTQITRGKIRTIEELSLYEKYLIEY
ncbi:MAG TPA: toprim domain-containing protein [Candidatus Nitrosotenuis sp.]|jgi:5S rRNA maturation endonuclease (ribonuclease M5)|nr:toprim domain-containing protein [Candidatus Nitrosotenuis sp.]